MALARMTKVSPQTIPSSTITKVALDTISFNDSCFCDPLIGRIKPHIAGYYQVNGQAGLNTLARIGYATVMVFKNGIEVSRGSQSYFSEEVPSGDPLISCTVSDLIYCNGYSDYLELFVYISTGNSSIQLFQSENYLSIEQIASMGSSGYSGHSGYSGAPYVGYSGYSGMVGLSGYSGYSSYSGISGFSGTMGFSGYSGLSGLADASLFEQEVDVGTAGCATIYWALGYKQFVTLTSKACLVFVPPTTTPGWTADLTLRIYDTAGSGKSVGWPTNIKWERFGEHGGPLTYFPGVGDYYLFRFYWDGQASGYLGWYHGPFRTYTNTACSCP